MFFLLNILLRWHWQWPDHLPPACSLKFRLSLTPSADICRGQSNCVSVGNKLSIGLLPIMSPMTRHVCQRRLSSQSERNWWFGGRVICGAGGCVRASLAGRRIWEGRGKARSYSHWLPSYFVLFLLKDKIFNTEIFLLEFCLGWEKARSLTGFLLCTTIMAVKSSFTRTTTIFSTTTNLWWPGKCNNTVCLRYAQYYSYDSYDLLTCNFIISKIMRGSFWSCKHAVFRERSIQIYQSLFSLYSCNISICLQCSIQSALENKSIRDGGISPWY